MRLVAHRGNLAGPIPALENSPLYIDQALGAGVDAEVDVHYSGGGWYLGHDEPTHPISIQWLLAREDFLWIHCKMFEALDRLADLGPTINAFWHEDDAYTLTTRHYIWTFPHQQIGPRSVLVDIDNAGLAGYASEPYGLCTDYPLRHLK